jgi:hypothetical protein
MMSIRVLAGLTISILAITSATGVLAACKDRLVNKSFACAFTSDSEFISQGNTCLEFYDETTTLAEPKFELDALGDAGVSGIVVYNCTCNPVGSQFNSSGSKFACAGVDFFEDLAFPWAIQGKVNRRGQKITARQVDVLASSYILECSSCANALAVANRLSDDESRDLEENWRQSADLARKRFLELQE